MLLFGFIGNCEYMNFDDFKVNGMNIAFNDSKNDEYHNFPIYPKTLIDLKQNVLFYEIYTQLEQLNHTNPNNHIRYKSSSITSPKLRMNYFFFENNINTLPNATSDELYLICKSFNDGKFKYYIFSPHEIIFDL